MVSRSKLLITYILIEYTKLKLFYIRKKKLPSSHLSCTMLFVISVFLQRLGSSCSLVSERIPLSIQTHPLPNLGYSSPQRRLKISGCVNTQYTALVSQKVWQTDVANVGLAGGEVIGNEWELIRGGRK